MFKYVLRLFFKAKMAWLFVAASLFGYLITAAIPYLNGTFIDFLISNTSVQSVLSFAVAVAGINLIGTALKYVTSMINVKVSANTAYLMLIDSVKSYEHAELCLVEEIEPSYLTQRLFTDVNTTSNFVISSFLGIPLGVLMALGVVAFFFYLDPVFAFVSIALLLAYFAAFAKLRDPLHRAALARKEADSIFFEDINSQISNVFNIQLTAKYHKSVSALENAYESYLPKIIRSSRISYLFSSIDGLISALFQAVLLIVAGVKIIEGSMTVGDFFMVSSYFSVLIGCAKGFVGYFQQWQDSSASFGRIVEILELRARAFGNSTIENLREVTVEDLSFSFTGGRSQSTNIFQNFSCGFKPSTTYAIVGENGSGKSTFLKLLTGLYDPGTSLKYNRTPVNALDRTKLLSAVVSTVPQHPVTSRQTVHDYIIEELGSDLAQHLLLKTQWSELSSYAKSVKQLLDVKCNSLSGGELRKVLLWVAVNKPHQLLILDEPTTGLDKQAREALCSYLMHSLASDRIIIVMTHDDDVIDACCEVVKLS